MARGFIRGKKWKSIYKTIADNGDIKYYQRFDSVENLWLKRPYVIIYKDDLSGAELYEIVDYITKLNRVLAVNISHTKLISIKDIVTVKPAK